MLTILRRKWNSRFVGQIRFLIKTDLLGFFKTILFNLKYLPLRQAIRLPVFISGNTIIGYCHKGFYNGCGKTGDLTFGIIDKEYVYPKPCHLRIFGTIVTYGEGMHAFGPGCIIAIYNNAKLKLGNEFAVSYDLHISCSDSISIGKNNMWSYGIDIRDTDGHPIRNDDNVRVNCNKPIVIGNKVWIGNRCQILKGVTIADNTIISSSSIVTKSQLDSNMIIASYGKVIKNFHSWGRY